MHRVTNQAYKDGRTFYLLAPGCDKKIAEISAKADLLNAFCSKGQIFDAYKKFDEQTKEAVYKYYTDYKRGVLDVAKDYPQLIPKKWKKLVDKLISNDKVDS